jgi:hypothetical protein
MCVVGTDLSWLSAASPGEIIARMNCQMALRSAPIAAGQSVAERAWHALRAECLGARDAGNVEHQRGGEPGGELGDAPERVGVLERALELSVDDRVGVGGSWRPPSPTGRWRSGSVQPAP